MNLIVQPQYLQFKNKIGTNFKLYKLGIINMPNVKFKISSKIKSYYK